MKIDYEPTGYGVMSEQRRVRYAHSEPKAVWIAYLPVALFWSAIVVWAMAGMMGVWQ